jgi:dTDP-L-rhamnose 4-epimerase
MKNVLITGGAGFIGSSVALKLLEKGYGVTVLDNLSRQIHGPDPERSFLYNRIKGKVSFILGDASDRDTLSKALRGQDAVIHLAAETGTGQSMYDIARYVDKNIGGTALLMDLLVNEPNSIGKVVVAESRAIYGEGRYRCGKHGYVYPIERSSEDMSRGEFECKCPVCGASVELVSTDELSAVHPTSVYGITKQVQGQLVHLVCKSKGIPSVSLRYQNVYGPGQSLSNPYTGILSIFSKSLLNGKAVNIFEDGKESRDFVYIDDVADATILAMESDTANYQALNIGSGVATSVLEVAETLKRFYRSTSAIAVSGNFRIGDIRHNYADISKAKDLIGYAPQYDFQSGIALFADWVKSQDLAGEDLYERSLAEMRDKGLLK